MDINFLTAEVNADPIPALESVRSAGRAVHNGLSGEWMLTGYDDVMRLLGQSRYASLEHQREESTRMFGSIILEVVEGKHHNDLRNVWAKDFSQTGVAERRALVRQIIEEGFDAFVPLLADGDVVDAVAGLTRSIPARVISHMLGVAPEMRADVIRWSDDMADSLSAMLDTSERGDQLREASTLGTTNLRRYLGGEIEKRRTSPSDDLIGKMVHSEIGQRISDEEMIGNCAFLTFAGNETTAKLLASIMVLMWRYPEQRALVAADRSLIPDTVEEVLRFASVAQMVPRILIDEPLEGAGRTFRRNEKVTLLLGAANRDPERWERPDLFDIRRKKLRNMGFGFGAHICLGLNLARLEAEIFLDVLLDRLPDYQVHDIDYGANFMLRGPQIVRLSRNVA